MNGTDELEVRPVARRAIGTDNIKAGEPQRSPRVAVLIPCHNEEKSIGDVVRSFMEALPGASVFVYDNNSTDRTQQQAARAGAIVRQERLQGKGNVVRRMFADIEAEVYVLVDGDGTYDASAAPELVSRLLEDQLDMVNAARDARDNAAYRPGHKLGNRLLTGLVALIFGNRIRDMLSGYRAFSRRYVKSFPAVARGFEIETELTVHALELRAPMDEILTPYFQRPSGTSSKLNTYKDGMRILRMILFLAKEERPLPVFLSLASALALGSIAIAWPLLAEYLETGLVPRLPTAVLSTGLMLVAVLCSFLGLILDGVTRGRREMKRMWYLRIPGPDV